MSFDPRFDRDRTCAQCDLTAVCYTSKSLCAVCELQRLIDDGEIDQAYHVALIEGVSPEIVASMHRKAIRHAQTAARINAMHAAVREMNVAAIAVRQAPANDNSTGRVAS